MLNFSNGLLATGYIESEKQTVFSALNFIQAPLWQNGLNGLQRQYTEQVLQCVNMIARYKTQYKDVDGDFGASIASMLVDTENDILLQSSQVNAALTKAIGGDGGNALLELSKIEAPNLSIILQRNFEAIRTEDLAPGRSFPGERRYIGYECNRLEGEHGITSTNAQWKMIYQQLKGYEYQLKDGDKKDALEVFRKEQPYDKDSDELRRFEKRINAMKNEMTPYCPVFVRKITNDTTS